MLTREIRRRRWYREKREGKREEREEDERAGERARSERKDVNPFLVSLQPIPPFLLIAGVLLSTGELYLLFLSLSLPLHSLFPPRDLLSLQPPLRSLYPESSSFVPLAPPSRSLLLISRIRVLPRFMILSLPPKHTRPRSLSYSPFSSRGEQKLRIREAFVESRGSIEGFRSAVRELRANHHVSYHGANV